jgi:tetratricopeptide (TPR) repeat protein
MPFLKAGREARVGEHPSEEMLERFLRGELGPAARQPVVLHLLGGCPDCIRGMAPLAPVVLQPERDPLVGGPELEESYHDAIDRAFAAVRFHGVRAARVKRDKARTLEGLRKSGLLGIPWNGSRAGNLEAALERARELSRSDPAQMVYLLGLVVLTAGDLEEDGYEPREVADFQARAAGECANALRINHLPFDAEKWLGRAFALADEGTGDPLLYARLYDLAGSQRIAQHRYQEALQMLEHAFHQYKRLGDRHLAGRVLIKIGRAAGLMGHPKKALKLLDRGAAMINKAREPELVGVVVHNQVCFLTDSQRFEKALSLLTLNRALLWEIAGPKLLGIEARILNGLGHFDMAEDTLKEAKALLQEAGDSVHTGLACLDLSALLMAQGRMAEGRAEAEEALAIYKTLRIEPEARKALALVADALRAELATAAFLQSVVTFLRRLEHQPWLRFSPAF